VDICVSRPDSLIVCVYVSRPDSLIVCVYVSRPDSLLYKSEVSTVVSDKRSLTSVRPAAHTRDTSPALLRHKEMSQSVSSADSASSLTRVGSV